jgi:hypothetical protein
VKGREMHTAGQERADSIGTVVKFGSLLVLLNFSFQSTSDYVE